jgi:hypothetical protein
MANPTFTLPDGQMLEIPATVMAELDRLDSLVDTISISTDADVAELNAVGKQALALHNALDRERQNSKAPYLETCTGIDDWARPFLRRMKMTQDRAKNKLSEYAVALQRRQAELLAKQQEAERAAAQVAPGPGRVIAPLLPVDDIPRMPSIPMRDEYDVKYTDINAIPRTHMIPDYDKILADLKSGKMVPGCELVILKKVVTR